MKIILAIIVFTVFTSLLFAQETLTIRPASQPPSPDGIINSSDPWEAENWIDINKAVTSNSSDNMSAKFQLMYDESNLYFAVIVNDDNRFTGNLTTYNNDCIEFFIAMDTTSGKEGTYKQGDRQIRMQAVADPSAPGGEAESGQGVPSSSALTCVDNGTYYVQEWILPWEGLSENMFTEWDQKQFKFDVGVANATGDGERTQLMFWNDNSDEQWRNTNHFGLVTLIRPLNTFADLAVDLPSEISVSCGSDVKLNPAVYYEGTGELIYSWSPSEGLDATNIANPVASLSTDQKYLFTVTSQEFGTVTDSVTIKIVPLTAKTTNVTINCGNEAQLGVTTNYTGSGQLLYKWSPETGLNDAYSANPIADLTSNADYSVEIKTPGGGCVVNKQLSVNVNAISYLPSLCMVTVNENDKNVLVIKKEDKAGIESYFVYRESSLQTDQYDLIGLLPYAESGLYVDEGSNAKVQSNKYKIAVKDLCGFVTNKSYAHKTLHLTINKGSGNDWNLIWEPYSGFPVSTYAVFRGTDKSNLVQIGNVSGGSTSFTDITAPAGDVFYQLEASLPDPCITLKSNEYTVVRSNIISNVDVSVERFNDKRDAGFIYPNPASDKLFISGSFSLDSQIEIFNLTGRKVISLKNSQKPIDISGLAKGIYIVKLFDSGKLHINKFTKE